jgi:hypothetical protein
MGDIFGGPGGLAQGPGSEYSESTSSGQSSVEPANIVDGPGGKGGDPTISRTRRAPVSKKEVGRDFGPDLTWEQRVLLLLSSLEATKGYKSLPTKIKAEVRALKDSAPDGAYS